MTRLLTRTPYSIELTGLATGGEAVGRLDGCVVFVEEGAPGDVAEVELTDVRKTWARGRIQRLLHESPLRVEPQCPIYKRCGGCQLQHIRYEEQLALKTRLVHDALRLHHLEGVPVHGCLPSPPLNYRTKMQLVAGASSSEGKRPQGFLGLYARHSHRVVRMDECLIAHPTANRILAAASRLLGELGWPVYDEASGRGLIRHVLARVSASSGQALVVLVATSDRLPRVQSFTERLHEAVPEVVGVAVNVNPARTNVVLGRATTHLWGEEHLIEEVRLPGESTAARFSIGPTAFFQVNPHGLATIAQTASRYLSITPDDTVMDAYCGVGSLSILAARSARRVLGVEVVAEAIEAARRNAALNGLEHSDFRVGKAEEVLPALVEAGERIDAVLLDPPRKGCERPVLEALCQVRVPRLVYVSCNPVTLARDLVHLIAAGYRVTDLQPVDMFPQTAHVECVTRLVYEGP